MPEEVKNREVSAEALEVMRSLIAAIRAVKLYPPNNPVYSQSVTKAHEALDRFLKTTPSYLIGVEKTCFTYEETAVGKDTQVNKPIAQDLFMKGIREITFTEGLTAQELLVLLRSLALSSEELGLKSGISSILWETDSTHIKVLEAGLGDIIAVDSAAARKKPAPSAAGESAIVKKIKAAGRTLVAADLLGDLLKDPEGFGAGMVELAEKTRGEQESVQDRLFVLYRDAAREIREKHSEQSDAMYEGLAKSALSLEPELRDGLVGEKLYGEFDADMANEQKAELEEHMPNELQEIVSGRFSNVWNVQQVASLLKRSSEKKSEPAPQPLSPESLKAEAISPDLVEIAREMAEYTPAERDVLKNLNGMGSDADIVEAAVRTLIFLLPHVKKPHSPAPDESTIAVFSGVVHQLEDMLAYLLKQKDYDLASLIVRALHMPVEPVFQPRLEEAIKKIASPATIGATLMELRSFPKNSQEYRATYAYLSIFPRETTEVLIQLIAEESDRATRVSLLEIVKDMGKDQIELLGVHLNDHRWYVVRNITIILGESKSQQALPLLQKAASHKDIRIRQEVIKGLLFIGGKKAAAILSTYLQDADEGLQLTALRALGSCADTGIEEARYLISYLENRPLKKKEQAHTVEAIRSLGKIGGNEALLFLKRYERIRWWKPRKLQKDLRAAARLAMTEIDRRKG